MLLTQALDKNYLDSLQSDSLITIAVEYYKREGDKLKAGKAYFYYGKVMKFKFCDKKTKSKQVKIKQSKET